MSRKNRKGNNNPFYRKPDFPSYRRRCHNHDYARSAKYMITLYKALSIPVLSVVSGDLRVSDRTLPEAPGAFPTETGSAFHKALAAWLRQYPQMDVDELVIMPDHIHFCLRVTFSLPTGLSRAIANLMGKTTRAHIERLYPGIPYDDIGPEIKASSKFFDKGFADSIAYTWEQYQTQRNYILDNPRRLLMKRSYPDLYRQRWVITAGDVELMAIGNIHLLKLPHLQVVRFSRKYTEQQLVENRMAWERCVANGGALISPFIHPVEKEMRNQALGDGGNIIRICDNGFSDRFAPAKTEFDYMGTYHLLLIGPMEYSSQKVEMRYSFAQSLNKLAELLASHPEGMRIRQYR